MSFFKSVYRDRLFMAAMLSAVLFWIILWLFSPPKNDGLHWVLTQPLVFLTLVFLFPLLEELTFRGLIQGWLERVFIGRSVQWQLMGVTLWNLLASLLFVTFHFFMHSFIWARAVLAPSLVFGYFRDKYRSVIPAIVLHVFYNGGYFFMYPPSNA